MGSKKTREKLYAIAEELIKTQGPCSTHQLSDYIVSKSGKNVRWLPERATISAWMKGSPTFYVDSKNLWHIR